MISTPTVLLTVFVAVGLYLLFYVIPVPPVVRNIIAIILAIVLLVVILNLLGALALF